MLLGLALSVPAHAEQRIGEIQFEGNSLNKSRALEKKIKSRRGHPVDEKKLNDDVKLLFETGFFDDVSVAITSLNKNDSKKRPLSRIIFTVQERPIIKRIDYKGNKQLRTSAFESKVQSEVDAPFDKFKASLDERAVLEHYRDEGYANAQVEHYTSLDQKTKKLILTFFITEGERIMVKAVEVAGAQRFSQKDVRKKMKTRRKKVFKNEVLMHDLQEIESFYKNKGHLDVVVSSPTVVIDDEKNEASISLEVTEGPRYTVGDISFNGSTIFTEKELRKAVVLKKKAQFNQERLDESLGNISSLYADRGYLRTEVQEEPIRNTDKGTVDFEINIAESSVVYVDGVYVDGNTYTKEYVVRREVLLKPGDIFSASKMRRSVEKIYNLGFLEDVQVDVQQPRSPELADIIFTVKDGKPGILSAGAGFSSVDRFVGSLQVQHTNLFGRAQRADITYEFGSRRQNFEIGWTDPWFLGHKMSGGIDLFNTLRRRDYGGRSSAFREERRGTSFRLGPRLSDDLGMLFSYTIQTTDIFDVDSSIKKDLFPTFGIPEEEAQNTNSVSQVKSSFLTEVAYDTRDNRFDATRGSRNSIALETSGGPFGGDIHFYKPQFSSAWYFPTFWKFVFSMSARGAWVNDFSPSVDVPSSERFFLGGADTIRGYDNNSIIPRTLERGETGELEVREIPGRIYTILNAEYKFPIVQEKNRTIFQGAFFLDVGGTWLESDDIQFTTGSKDKQMKAGVGFGFRFKTPVFPIRLDFAIPLNPRPADGTRGADSKSLQPYFTIGNIF